MTTTQLTPYLLDSSLLEYVTAVTGEALRSIDPVLQEQTRKRATYALQFFLDILDPSITEERKQLETFRSYRAALDDPNLAAQVAPSLPLPGTEGLAQKSDSKAFDLSPAQRVLSLPDTLESIFGHISLMTQSDRATFRQAALTSHAFYNAAQLRLWRRPRDLNTLEQQVRFAFGTAISGVDGDSLGNYVKRLRIRIIAGGGNLRIVEKIAALTPAVVDLTLHWGDTEDSTNELPATPSMVASVHKILSSFPNLTHLYLAKFAYTPPTEEELQFPADAHGPFTRLEYFQIYDFHWYWEPISRGLGPALKELDIGFGTMIDKDKIVELSAKLTSLSTLRVTGLEARHVRSIVETHPNLEQIQLIYFEEQDDEFAASVVLLLASLQKMKELRFNAPIGSTQLKFLADSPSPLEVIYFRLQMESEVEDALVNLLNAKRQTLKTIKIDFDEEELAPSDKLVEAFASIPHLEEIFFDFPSQPHGLSSSSVDKLLKQCPKLKWTYSLEELVEGNLLYEKEFKFKLERERDESFEELEEDILCN